MPVAGGGTLLQNLNEAVISPAAATVDLAYRTLGAAYGAYQGGVSQAGAEIGQPQLGNDLAAMPDAFAGQACGTGMRAPGVRPVEPVLPQAPEAPPVEPVPTPSAGADMGTVADASPGLGTATNVTDGAAAAEEAAKARGLSKYGGVFSSKTNAIGGEVWTSVGDISQKDFSSLVNSGMYKGDVNIISGVHGLPDGSTLVDRSLYEADVVRFGDHPGVTVHSFPEMAPEQINGLLNGPGTTIGGFCNSGVCLEPYKRDNKSEVDDMEAGDMKLYRAMIWTRDPNRPGQRVSVCAENLSEAKNKLVSEYGEGNVYDLHNEEDAERVR